MKFWFHLLLSGLFLTSCSLGEKEGDDIEDIRKARDESRNSGSVPAIEWVNVAVWPGPFNKPVDVMVGFDRLIYVADELAGTVYQFDENGKQLGSWSGLKSPTKLGMDRRLNLFVAGRFDTTINNRVYNLPAVFYLDMTSSRQVLTTTTRIQKRIIHPYYFNPSGSGLSDAEKVSFAGIAVFGDNSFYLARRGPVNSLATALGGYDNTIVQFDKNQNYIGHLSSQLEPSNGAGLKSIVNPISLTSYAAPPQSNGISQSKDFIFGIEGQSFYRVQGLTLTSEDLYDYDRKFLSQDTSKTKRFMYGFVRRSGNLESRFASPADIAVAADKNQFILVVDNKLDSVFQFTASGEEGVPVFGRKHVITSFGGTGSGVKQFRNPSGIAYGTLKLYVADTGNRRIMVYKLSSDITGN
ncbi:MAG: hypothetical protein HUU10_01250 [Bacteroidetes bacterium]|nr:hypothetical protein [Bacteroidota bacterium]